MSGIGVPSTAAVAARKLIEPLQPGLLRLLRRLVQTNSVAIPPHGNETPAQELLRDFLLAHQVETELYTVGADPFFDHPRARHDRNYGGRHNLAARLPGSGAGKSLLLNGHMDTVPPGRAPWRDSPWSGTFRDGRVYGLGSFDMKGGLVAQAAVLSCLRRADVRLGGDLLFESVIDEEWGGGGGTLAARLRGVTADACIISEGTGLQIFRATRGGFVVDLVLEAGDPAAYFTNAEAVSPAAHLGALLDWVESWRNRRASLSPSGAYASFPDPAPLQILAVEANRLDRDVPLSVPTHGTVRLYFQFLPSENVPALLAEVRESLRHWEQQDPFFRAHPIRWVPLYHPPLLGHEIPEEHPLVETMVASVAAHTGIRPRTTAAPYPCDAFLMDREFRIPTVLFGPSGAGAHNPDEHVDFASVLQTSAVILTAALEWCNG